MIYRPSYTLLLLLLHRVTIAATLALVALLWLPDAAEARARSGRSQSLARSRSAIGHKYYRAGNFTRALAEFQKAYKLFPRSAYLVNMGQCYRKLGKLGKALTHYKLYLIKGGAKIRKADRRLAKRHIRWILQISTAVTLKVEPAGTVVHINRRKVGTAPLPGTVRLRNGTYKVVLTHPDCFKLTKFIEVGRKLPKKFSFELKTTGKPRKRLTYTELSQRRLREEQFKEDFVLNPKGLRLARSGKKYWIAGLMVLSAGVVLGVAGSTIGFLGGSGLDSALQDASLVFNLVGFPLLAYGTGRQISGIIIGSDGMAKGVGRGARMAGYVLMSLACALQLSSSAWMGYVEDEDMSAAGGGIYYVSLALLVTGTVLFITNAYSGWDTKGQDKAARREAAQAFPIQNLRIGAAPTRGGGVMSLGFDF